MKNKVKTLLNKLAQIQELINEASDEVNVLLNEVNVISGLIEDGLVTFSEGDLEDLETSTYSILTTADYLDEVDNKLEDSSLLINSLTTTWVGYDPKK